MKPTLTKAVLTEQLCKALGFSKVETQAFIETFFEVIAKTLKSGENVKLSGFGNFILLNKKDRQGRNPKTGDGVLIKARRVVTFRAGNKLKKRVQGGEAPNESAEQQIEEAEEV
jgi:integration host factor subunit alpha